MDASRTLDPRVTPARPDLAARHLAGRVKAARYVDGGILEVVAPVAPLRHVPSPDAALDTEALKGERATIFESNEEGWSWGQLEADKYVGWLPSGALGPPGPRPTHRVSALRTLTFPGPDIKLPPLEALSLGCRLVIVREEAAFAVTQSGGYLPRQHLAVIEQVENDFVAVAERFVGTPYLWGGRTSSGIDCSGLVQIALGACGIACPRDSDMQEGEVGSPVPGAAADNLRRGDLLFWKGHVAIARDAATAVHANAFHMAVVVEPIATALARIRAAGNALKTVRRL